MVKASPIRQKAIPRAANILLTKTATGASSSCFRSKIGMTSTPHAQNARHNLKRYGQTAHEFAIEFHGERFSFASRARNDLFRQRVADFAHAQMSTEIKPRRVCENPERAGVANGDDIEITIVEFRIRRDLHGPAIVARIGNSELRDSLTSLGLFVKLNVNL